MMHRLIPALCAALLVPQLLLAGLRDLRAPDEVYLEDFLSKPVLLDVPKPTPVFYDRSMRRYLGTLRAGQKVQLQAFADGAFRVRGQAQQGQVAGWLKPEQVQEVPEQFLADLRQAAERARMVAELIAQNEIAVGMTIEEVEASLGRPDQKSYTEDAQGREDVWEYIAYERMPQRVRRYHPAVGYYTDTVYVKVPVGRKSVSFVNGVVEKIQQTEEGLEEAYRPKIVSQPLTIY